MASARDIDAEQDPAAPAAESETGLDSNVAGALSYLFGIVSGLIFFLVEKDDPFVRWHAAQSIAFAGLVTVVTIIFTIIQFVITAVMFTGITGSFILGSIISLILGLVWLVGALGVFVAWLYLMIKTYQGGTPRLPVAASIADRLA